MFSTPLNLGLAGIGRVYGSFYSGLGAFLLIVSIANSIPFSPLVRQWITYVGHFGVLYVALGFVNLFSFMLLRKNAVGYFLLFVHVCTAVFFLLLYLSDTTGSVLLASESWWFAYWDPQFTPLSACISLGLVIFAASIYSVFLFKTGMASTSREVRRKSFIFAIGSVIAAFSGTSYFISPLVAETARPYIVALAIAPGILGFGLMVLPLFLKEKK